MRRIDRARARPHIRAMTVAHSHADIAVIGGGLVGQTLALALDQAGLSVVVVDASQPQETLAPHFDGRGFAIAFASYRMLRALGVADALDATAQPIRRIMVTDGRPAGDPRGGGASLRHLHFDAREIDPEGGEALGVMLEARHLRRALDQAVRARPSIRMIQPMTVSDLARDGVVMRATLQSGEVIAAPLLVGADGRRSFVRGWAGVRTIDRAYDATALVCTVAHEKPHGGVAHEYFLPSGPFAILPLTNNRANVVWVERPEATAALLRLSDDAFHAELMRRFGSFLGAVTLEGPRFSYPLALKLAEKMIAPRIALAGDSAHGIHPIAGQGLNQGLKDVAALAECVADAVALGLDAGDATALERYQRWRRFDNVAMAAATDMFDRLFSNDIAPVRFARDVGLSIVNRIGPARRYFMRTAGGAAGDLPKLLRGESLAA